MKRQHLSAWIALSLGITGCVSKGTYQEAQKQLEECRKDKASAQESFTHCKERFDQEAKLWQSISASVNEAVPKALKDFETERDRIITMLPEKVRSEVDSYLAQFAKAMSVSFTKLREDNERLMTEVRKSQTGIAEVGAAIDEKVGRRLDAADVSRGRMVDETNALIGDIQEWDRTYVNEKASDRRLGLSRKERETITLFHDKVVARLNTIATMSGAAPGAGDAETEAPAPGEEGSEPKAES